MNGTPQHAIVDTGSSITIINQQLLKKIHHKKFIYQRKQHAAANCTSLNIIGEIKIEIKIHGHKTNIIADVATNLVTDLLLGNDWIRQNNVIIDSPQQRITLLDNYYRAITSTSFVEPPNLHFPVLLTREISLSPFSESCVEVNIPAFFSNTGEVIFEPTPNLQQKCMLAANAIIKIDDNKSKLVIINASANRRTLSRNTKLGNISYQSTSVICLTLPTMINKRTNRSAEWSWDASTNADERNMRARSPSSCTRLNGRRTDNDSSFHYTENRGVSVEHECYVCREKFLSGNDLRQHLQDKCFPSEMREQIQQMTKHLEDRNQRRQVEEILWKYGKLFDLRQPSKIKSIIRYAIETGDNAPTFTPPYRVSYRDEQAQRDEINKLLKQGIIEESTSPWSSPIVLVRKKDGSTRFCIDFRKLNSVTTKDAFPIPRIEDIFDHLSQAEYYTTIDFKSGYFQVGLDPKDRPKTAFSTRDQHLQFTVLPQGVTNGPPAFQRIVSRILGPTRWQYSLAYLDDVIIYSNSFKEHLIHLDDILQRLEQANFRLNVEKCQIAKTEINFLGHSIEQGNIRPNADNIQALLNTPQPSTAKEAFRFVKAVEYYRKFIPRFSEIAEPLHKFAPTTKDQRTKKSQSSLIELSDNEINAFNELKRIMTNDLVLRIPNDQLPFKVQTDASKVGIGAVLMQTYPNGDLPIAYLSKKLTSTQMNWPATEQECYAIISAIEKWHKYLDGRPFVIETDHKPLLPFNLKQQLNSKCERWRLKLQRYQFTVRYIKGKHNTVADYLSRSPVDDASNDEDDYAPIKSRGTQTDMVNTTAMIASVTTRARSKQKHLVDERIDSHLTNQTCDEKQKRKDNASTNPSCVPEQQGENSKEVIKTEDPPSTTINVGTAESIDRNEITPFTYDQLKTAQHEDEEAKQMIGNIGDYKKYFIEDNMLMRRGHPSVPFVPKGEIRLNIMKIYHDSPGNGAHFGRDRTETKIKQRYFWPSMYQDIKNDVQSCIPCAQHNPRRCKPPGELKPIKPPSGVWQLLSMDFHGPIQPITSRGNRYIIAITDVLSKFVITRAVRDCTGDTAARFLKEDVICKYGTPKCILTDNGTHFTSAMMNSLLKELGVTHLYSTPYHPQTNGQIERYNSTMDAKIATLANARKTDWDDKLPFVTFNYNTTIHATTKQIPFEMLFGRQPILPFDHQDTMVTLEQDTEHAHKLKEHLASLTDHAISNILKNQQQYKNRYDQHRSNPLHQLGDLVLIKTMNNRRKFDVRHEGPFRIIQKLASKTYVVQHVKQSTMIKQVTVDSIIPLIERRNLH